MSLGQFPPDELPMMIAGQPVRSSDRVDNINPSDLTDRITAAHHGNGAHVRQAVHAATDAFARWSDTNPQIRHDILLKTGNTILETKAHLAQLLAREEGKILREAAVEVERAGRIFQYFAGEVLRISGERLPSLKPNVGVETLRQPVGVVGIITPWNFPIAIPAWKIAPALAFGNAVIFKPAEDTPATAWALVDILHRCGLPDGVLNLVFGDGRTVGHAMLESEGIDAISFTGSQQTGGLVAQACAKHMRRFQLEMGGKNPLVVLDDADLERSVECAIDGAFYSTGQRCTASSRLIVTQGICGRFIEACFDRIRDLKTGHALEEDTDIGPVINKRQFDSNRNYIEIARREGGVIRAQSAPLTSATQGHFQQPVLITDTTPEMTINRQEVFGPIASVIRVQDYDEALAVANDSAYGLCAGICTNSLKHARDFQQRAQAGVVMVNLPTAGVDYHVPFGGMKSSSFGHREQGYAAREFFTLTKTSYLQS